MALEKVFCPDRDGPLILGAVKSNMGHAEPAACLCSITKVIIAMETGYIPPNINLTSLRKDIPAFHNGKIIVMTEKTPWAGSLVGINSFGFGGANCHLVLKWNEKNKINEGAPSDDIPRLIAVSGRTEDAVNTILSYVMKSKLDVEFIKLLHEIHVDEIPGHIYRGYAVLNNSSSSTTIHSVKKYQGEKRALWFVFTGMGCQWPGMAKSLLKIPVFSTAIENCDRVLKPLGLDIFKIITEDDTTIFDNIIHCFVGITAVQIGLVDILTAVGVVPDYIIGHSVGELGCAYADGCLTAEQVILAAYYRGLVLTECELYRGSMAVVGLSCDDLQAILPSDIDIACYNSFRNCTIAGPSLAVQDFIAKMEKQNVFSREVNVSNYAFHSRYISPVRAKLLSYMKQVIPNPKPRSTKWLSTSVEEEKWKTTSLTKLCSAEYFTNNFVSPVLFGKVTRHVQPDAITVEIAAHGLLQSILRESLNKGTINIPLTKKGSLDNSVNLTHGLGKLFEAGVNLQLSALYPEVSLPVSRGTPMIAPLVHWQHNEDWFVADFSRPELLTTGVRTVNISSTDPDYEYLASHIVDQQNLYPVMGFLVLVWETLALMRGDKYTELSVVFEDIRFHRTVILPKEGSLDFVTNVHKGNGHFEVVVGKETVASGRIYVPDDVDKESLRLSQWRGNVEEKLMDPDLTHEEVYQELFGRGHHYNGIFRSIINTNNSGSRGKVQWHNNWVVFLDSMLQMQTINKDTRDLLMPSSIKKVVIDVKKHHQLMQAFTSENKELPVRILNGLELIKCGGVEIKSLNYYSAPRNKPVEETILEKYQFHPYISNNQVTDVNTFVYLAVTLALENVPSVTVKTVELVDNSSVLNDTLLSAMILQTLESQPFARPDVIVSSNMDDILPTDLGMKIKVTNWNELPKQTALVVVGSRLFSQSREEVFKDCLSLVTQDGFLLSRQKLTDKICIPEGFAIALKRDTVSERLLLVHQVPPLNLSLITAVNIVSDNFDWMPQLQSIILENAVENSKIVIYAEQEPTSGILGMFNCLRVETVGINLSCVFVMDSDAPKFSLDVAMYRDQLAKNLPMNVFKDGVWGSYRYTPLSSFHPVQVDHVYLDSVIKGDISSITWMQGLLINGDTLEGRHPVDIYYAAINTRDIMIANGELPLETVFPERINQRGVYGIEYSGRTSSGQRVMGINKCRCLSNKVIADTDLMWNVPDSWSLEEAATVPVAYTLATYGLVTCAFMRKGETVLVHTGYDGVGLAAINLALYHGCTVFTTAETPEQVQFLRNTFPQIEHTHIGKSGDCSIEAMVMSETSGRGVDIVFNLFNNDQLQTSFSCLAEGGRFLHIGKDASLGIGSLLKARSFIEIPLELIIGGLASDQKQKIKTLVCEGIKNGAIKPLIYKVFKEKNVKEAFRYRTSEKILGKILVQLRVEEKNKVALPRSKLFYGRPRWTCDSKSIYVIIGGLGGVGLELADWLVMRGCKKLIFASRSGVTTAYQVKQIRTWQSYGVDVHAYSANVITEQGVTELLKQVIKLGPINTIFNLAMILESAMFVNQTEETFDRVNVPKAVVTKNLDRVSRKLCPNLQHFVIFSTISCRGVIGVTNYAMGNSVCERICELRKRDGLPALAIQWGPIGDVGFIAHDGKGVHEAAGGAQHQPIRSCLELLEELMTCEEPVISCIVLAEKPELGAEAANDNIVATVANILGIKDLNTISHSSTLSELGMESVTVVEIRHKLILKFNLSLNLQELRVMTFAKLQSIADEITRNPRP